MTRDVPYFPCYASNILADKHYRLMTLAERGLWISIYLECWPNKSVPSDLSSLARYLGFPQDELERIPKINCMQFFEENIDEIISPELEAYRVEVYGRRERQSLGGKRGAAIKKSKKSEGVPIGLPEGTLDQVRSNQLKSTAVKPIDKVKGKENSDETAEISRNSESYLKASKG